MESFFIPSSSLALTQIILKGGEYVEDKDLSWNVSTSKTDEKIKQVNIVRPDSHLTECWLNFESSSHETKSCRQKKCFTVTTPHVTLSFLSHNFWAQKSIPVIPYPLYSTELNPSVSFFRNWNMFSMGVISGNRSSKRM